MLCEISSVVFGIHCPHSACTGMLKNISIDFFPWKSLKSVSARVEAKVLNIKFNETYVRYLDVEHNIFLSKWVYIAKTTLACEHRNVE